MRSKNAINAGRLGLQRRFIGTFQGGRTGTGLLLLRAAVGLTAIVQGSIYLMNREHPSLGTWAIGSLAVASGACLLLGFLTPIASGVAGLGCVGVALTWLPAMTPNRLDTTPSILFLITMATALILLGPGAFSLDARLFGRREIIIPLAAREPDP
jgi:uncharacterized membrane protein YphA (DoxX/SURF4 family)